MTEANTEGPSASDPSWWGELRTLGMEMLERFGDHDHALRNARSASTEMSQARVERESVELFLEERGLASAHQPPSVEGPLAEGR